MKESIIDFLFAHTVSADMNGVSMAGMAKSGFSIADPKLPRFKY
jgi:hypothetical protein